MKLQIKSIQLLVTVFMLAMSATTFAQDRMKMDDEDYRSFEVTVTNLTSSETMEHGQPFSPSLFVTHIAGATPLFKVGQKASFGLARMAEEGNAGPTLSEVIVPMLGKSYGHAAQQISIFPGQSRTTYITTNSQFPMLSAAWMLVRTNDGFAGLDAVNLWNMKDKEPMTMELQAWDAGSERNNERRQFLVAKMGTDRDLENGVVAAHQGIKGNADAPATWKFFPNAVARVTITKVKLDKDVVMKRKATMNGGMMRESR